MESRLVLIIEGDDKTANRLAAAIRDVGHEVVVSATAAAGLAAAVEIRPDCVVCDVDLPDSDGHSVARSIRTHPSAVAVTPFLFLSSRDDVEAHLEGFHVGADVYLTKPLDPKQVVAQVQALVQMAARLRKRRDSILSLPPDADYGSTAIEGDVRQMSVATVLSVLGMERRTGMFEVVSKKRRAQVEIAAGYVVHGTIGGTRVAAISALRLMLTWKVGRFAFSPLPPCEPPASLRTVQALLLDAAKAEDEFAAGMPGSVRIQDGSLLGSFGGPASRPDDTAPPSSRAMREGANAPVSLTFDLIPSKRAESAKAKPPSSIEERALLSALDREWGSPSSVPPPRALPTARPQDVPETRRAGQGPILAIETSEDGTISVDLADMSEEDFEEERDAERMLINELTADRIARSAAPTPPAGMPITRRNPAIVPPPASAAEKVLPLPAPPQAPRSVSKGGGAKGRPHARAGKK
ncbi:MAG: response regulator [Polyangiaceae bacterium]|nr:response regulator [Polyangiaceae bacterium]